MLITTDLYLSENISNPLRSGKVKISVGKTSNNQLTQYYIMIDDLDWLMRLKPSFVMLFSDESVFSHSGDKTNTIVVYPRYANKNMEFTTLAKGTADLTTYFFGNPKDNRTFDWYYRLFEIGFKLTNFKGLEKAIFKLGKNTIVNITSKDYKHPDIFTGKTSKFKIRARVSREN